MLNDMKSGTATSGSGVEHLKPEGPTLGNVELSIVIPAMNEEVTVGEFIEWCKEGLKRAGVVGQILIVDSSTDNTAKIVLEHGGEVLRTPKRGVGRAYIDAIPYIRGKWILMGDADLTYDFRELAPFVEEFRKGAEFVMGSRFRGNIEKGAMPRLHRYFGTPLTNWILNRIYHSNYSDIHCGIRGVTLGALEKINIRSESWEYAKRDGAESCPIQTRHCPKCLSSFTKIRRTVSHHRRVGWLSPSIAGWENLKVMPVHAADSFLLKPGIILMTIGILFSLALSAGPVRIGNIGFGSLDALCANSATTLGYSSIQIGILARVMHGLRPQFVGSVQKVVTYDRGMWCRLALSWWVSFSLGAWFTTT